MSSIKFMDIKLKQSMEHSKDYILKYLSAVIKYLPLTSLTHFNYCSYDLLTAYSPPPLKMILQISPFTPLPTSPIKGEGYCKEIKLMALTTILKKGRKFMEN